MVICLVDPFDTHCQSCTLPLQIFGVFVVKLQLNYEITHIDLVLVTVQKLFEKIYINHLPLHYNNADDPWKMR